MPKPNIINEAISRAVATGLDRPDKLQWFQAVPPEIQAAIKRALAQDGNTDMEDAVITLAGLLTFIELAQEV